MALIVRNRLAVRIAGSHPADRGSIPRYGSNHCGLQPKCGRLEIPAPKILFTSLSSFRLGSAFASACFSPCGSAALHKYSHGIHIGLFSNVLFHSRQSPCSGLNFSISFSGHAAFFFIVQVQVGVSLHLLLLAFSMDVWRFAWVQAQRSDFIFSFSFSPCLLSIHTLLLVIYLS